MIAAIILAVSYIAGIISVIIEKHDIGEALLWPMYAFLWFFVLPYWGHVFTLVGLALAGLFVTSIVLIMLNTWEKRALWCLCFVCLGANVWCWMVLGFHD